MKRFLLLLSFLLAGLAFSQLGARDRDDDDKKLSVTVGVSKPALTVGDSCVVTFVVRSLYPILRVESRDELESSKRVRFRRLPVRRQVRRSLTRRGVTYALVWAHYVVVPALEGEIRIPACKFKAELLEPAADGGKRTLKAEASSERVEIAVKPKPQPTMRDLLRRGGRVI